MTTRRASARAAIATIARALRDERERVVFVGGTVPALYPLESGCDLRPTLDVDCVVDLETTASYYAFMTRLRGLGFQECRDEGAPLCRLTCEEVRVDVNATAATGIGPTNRWYAAAVRDAEIYEAEQVRVLCEGSGMTIGSPSLRDCTFR